VGDVKMITRIAIEEVLAITKRRQEINKIPLRHIIWTKDETPIDIDRKTIEDWDFTGLSNIDFITSRFSATVELQGGDPMKTKYKYIHFVKKDIDSDCWICRSNFASKSKLGEVVWYEKWKEYNFNPVDYTGFSIDCLLGIADFLRQLNEVKK
jgi:hypothetical protein